MKMFKKFLLIIFCNVLLITNLNSKEVPDSFADLVEKLIPSVVNISATRVIETRYLQKHSDETQNFSVFIEQCSLMKNL